MAMKIENVEIMGLESSIKASKYPMAVDTDMCTTDVTNTVVKLGSSGKGEGHDQFLTGICVNFDLTFSIKAWVEIERYRYICFISSQSTMHRMAKFDLELQFNEYVDHRAIALMQELKDRYLETNNAEDYLRLLYNNPVGMELTARMTTNYRALKTVYFQRKNHRLPEWRLFCEWCETLPLFREIVLANVPDEKLLTHEAKGE